MRNTILIIAFVVISQTDYLLVHGRNNQNGNTFFGFQFQPFQATFNGSASYINRAPEIESTTEAATTTTTAPAARSAYYETISARSGFELNAELNKNFNILNIGQDIIKSIEQVFHSLGEDVSEKIANAKKYAKVLGDNLKALIENYQYIRLRGSFLALKTTLETVSKYADILHATSEKVQQNLADQVNEVNDKLLESVAEWSAVILDRLDERTDNNEWAQAQAQPKINEVINRYGAFGESCKEEAYAELKIYQDKINAAVQNIETLQDKSLNVIQQCIATNANVYECVRNINTLIRDLRLSIYALNNLNLEGIRLNWPVNSYGKRRCVVQNSQELQLEKLSVEIQIELIRSQAADHPNQVTTSVPTTENPNQGSGSTGIPTTENPNQGSGSTGIPTTENPNQGSGSTGIPTSENPNQGSGSTGIPTTENPNQGSGSTGIPTTENPNQGSGSTGIPTTQNPNQGSGSTGIPTSEDPNQGSGSTGIPTSENPNQGSGSTGIPTTQNPNQGSGSTGIPTSENPNQGSGSIGIPTTQNPNQGSGSTGIPTSEDPNQGSGSTGIPTSENPNQGSGSTGIPTSEDSNQGSGNEDTETIVSLLNFGRRNNQNMFN